MLGKRKYFISIQQCCLLHCNLDNYFLLLHTCADIHRKLALACALDKEICHFYVMPLSSTLKFRQLFSTSWYMLCAGIYRKLALACAWDKEIFQQNIKILSSTL